MTLALVPNGVNLDCGCTACCSQSAYPFQYGSQDPTTATVDIHIHDVSCELSTTYDFGVQTLSYYSTSTIGGFTVYTYRSSLVSARVRPSCAVFPGFSDGTGYIWFQHGPNQAEGTAATTSVWYDGILACPANPDYPSIYGIWFKYVCNYNRFVDHTGSCSGFTDRGAIRFRPAWTYTRTCNDPLFCSPQSTVDYDLWQMVRDPPVGYHQDQYQLVATGTSNDGTFTLTFNTITETLVGFTNYGTAVYTGGGWTLYRSNATAPAGIVGGGVYPHTSLSAGGGDDYLYWGPSGSSTYDCHSEQMWRVYPGLADASSKITITKIT